MSDFDDLDELLGPLRRDATPAELASEHDVVALMAANHASKGTTMFTSRRARVATLFAAGIIGFGAVAAAGPAAYDLLEQDSPVEEEQVDETEEAPVEEPAVEEPAVEEEGEDLGEPDGEEQGPVDEPVPAPTENEEPAATDEDTTEPPVDLDDDATTFDENLCLDGNHGKTVSAAARGDLDIGEFTQRDVAQSSCGKTADSGATETDEETDVEDEVDEETETEEKTEEVVEKTPPGKGKSDQAPGKSAGKQGKGAKKGG